MRFNEFEKSRPYGESRDFVSFDISFFAIATGRSFVRGESGDLLPLQFTDSSYEFLILNEFLK